MIDLDHANDILRAALDLQYEKECILHTMREGIEPDFRLPKKPDFVPSQTKTILLRRLEDASIQIRQLDDKIREQTLIGNDSTISQAIVLLAKDLGIHVPMIGNTEYDDSPIMRRFCLHEKCCY